MEDVVFCTVVETLGTLIVVDGTILVVVSRLVVFTDCVTGPEVCCGNVADDKYCIDGGVLLGTLPVV